MPNYEYLCDGCGYNFEVVQSIKDDSWMKCLECGEDKLHRVLHAVSVFSRGEPMTIVQQAERNTSRMGKYELEDKHEDSRKVERPKPERPFWRKTDKIDLELAKLAPDVTIEKGKITKSEPLSQKAMNYIMKGEK